MTTSRRARALKPTDFTGSREVCTLLRIDKSTLTRRIQRGEIEVWGQLDGDNGALIFEKAYIERLAAEVAA